MAVRKEDEEGERRMKQSTGKKEACIKQSSVITMEGWRGKQVCECSALQCGCSAPSEFSRSHRPILNNQNTRLENYKVYGRPQIKLNGVWCTIFNLVHHRSGLYLSLFSMCNSCNLELKNFVLYLIQYFYEWLFYNSINTRCFGPQNSIFSSGVWNNLLIMLASGLDCEICWMCVVPMCIGCVDIWYWYNI